MLEADGRLQTWALAQVPIDWRAIDIDSQRIAKSNTVEVERLPDHRLAYLAYEGQVSGERGQVRQLDAGTYRGGATPALIVLEGRVLRGEIEIVSMAGRINTSRLVYRPASSAEASVCPAT